MRRIKFLVTDCFMLLILPKSESERHPEAFSNQLGRHYPGMSY